MKKNEISLLFPTDKFKYYLKEIGIEDESLLSKDQVDGLFRKLSMDFRNEKLSLDDFSLISDHLYWYFNNLTDKEWLSDKYSAIKNILEIAADLSYQVRHPSDTLLEYLEEALTYADYSSVDLEE